ncbi:hypothetical protein SDC9_160677 [bioreactor metagenome]|uniref:Uncharacterized protein n=1 Tax=bioreactor metagenome TaxID=1076179 RepID=A0A645FIA1_9ZZZZ
MPSSLFLPFALGISTLLTGLGLYFLVIISLTILSWFFSRYTNASSAGMPSMPGAPSLDLTFLAALVRLSSETSFSQSVVFGTAMPSLVIVSFLSCCTNTGSEQVAWFSQSSLPPFAAGWHFRSQERSIVRPFTTFRCRYYGLC